MWGCHFLILSSNALWRKFVKLDQGRLKLVYKSVSEGRRRRNVVHLRLLDAFNQPNWVVQLFSPLLFFRLVASAVRCHVFWHFALERMRGCEGGKKEKGVREWECEQKTETVAFSPLKTNMGSRPFPQVDVFTNRLLTVWAPQSKVAFVHLLRLPWNVQCPGESFILSKHRCSRIVSMQHSAIYWEAERCHFHTLTRS